MGGVSRFGTPGDVRGFYGALGIHLSGWSRREAPVRCFADPDAHDRADKDPSCSVNLDSGAFRCHSCGASGGAYDAALHRGRDPRQAIDLMVDFGLTRRREGAAGTGAPRPAGHPARRLRPALSSRPRSSTSAPGPRVPGADLENWAARLVGDQRLLARLARERAWSEEPIRRFGVGWDGSRVVLPVHDLAGRLVAVARYSPPWLRGSQPKLRAVAGSRQALFPSPAAIKAPTVWIVEGHPDALAAISAGIPAMAIPGVWGWQAQWASMLAGRDVVVCMDCDAEGRAGARRIAADLKEPARSVRVLDLAPERTDGYDLTDVIIELREDRHPASPGGRLLARARALDPL
jgi:hypothetical protein